MLNPNRTVADSTTEPRLADILEDGNLSEDSIFEDQNEDDAQAVLQLAMSATASHLTSCQTPAIEKAAALEGQPFSHLDLSQGDGDGDGDSTPEAPSSPEGTPGIDKETKPSMSLGQLPSQRPFSPPTLPRLWQVGPKDPVVEDSSLHHRGVLGNALGPSRHRSRSAGQEALKRLQKAFPSLSTPSHILPSLNGSFFSSFTDRSSGSSPTRPSHVSSRTPLQPHTPIRTPDSLPSRHPLQTHQRTSSTNTSLTPTAPRPSMLRRVTSDDSMLYHSLSRVSSLEDENTYPDVREQVNMRLMALKDSLPEVPNFKMPTLAKIQAASRKSQLSLNTMFFNEGSATPRPAPDREASIASKDPQTALDRVLEHLTGDIVILGGYRGSVLRSAEPPHQQVWAPVKLGLNMRKVNLEVGLNTEDEESMEDNIIPSGMLKHIGPIDVSRKLFKKLRACDNAKSGRLRVWDYGYDWRLSPSILSRKLQEFLGRLPSNRPDAPADSRGALVVAHSLGGIITRHAVNQRPELFSGVLYAGVPQRAINILGPFRNGDVVLFNEKLLNAYVNFSIRTSFVFLPDDGFCFVDKATGEPLHVDFYNAEDWVKYNLSPCVGPVLRPARPHSSSLSSLLPNSFWQRGDNKTERRPPTTDSPSHAPATHVPGDRTIAPQMNTGTTASTAVSAPSSDAERQRYLEYLTRTLAETRQFRAELAHSPKHQESNAYPPFALMYGKAIPTVYAVQVAGREAIPGPDTYDDLLFRSGDGVVLAKEAMLPAGYSLVRGGRVNTERGHITMLGDLPGVGKALEAILRGRRKGIGLTHEENA